MHELGITQGIIEHVREAARKEGARKVTDVFLTLAPTADFTADSITMYYEMLTEDDEVLKGAALHFASVTVSATCLECSDEFATASPRPVCPQCGSPQVAMDRGVAMIQLDEIGVEEGAAPEEEAPETRAPGPPEGPVPM